MHTETLLFTHFIKKNSSKTSVIYIAFTLGSQCVIFGQGRWKTTLMHFILLLMYYKYYKFTTIIVNLLSLSKSTTHILISKTTTYYHHTNNALCPAKQTSRSTGNDWLTHDEPQTQEWTTHRLLSSLQRATTLLPKTPMFQEFISHQLGLSGPALPKLRHLLTKLR